MNHAKCYVPGYPRIQFVRQDFRNLNGQWDFVFLNDDISNLNIAEINFDKTIKVPYAYQSPLSGIADSEYHRCVGYRKTFTYSKNKDKDLLLHFEAVDYEAFVYLNGNYIGTHKGGYTRFSFDITKYVKDGENEIIVLVVDGKEADKVRGKAVLDAKAMGLLVYRNDRYLEKCMDGRSLSCKTLFYESGSIKEKDALRFEYEIENFVPGIQLAIHIEYASHPIADVMLFPKSEHGDIEISIKNEYEAFRVQQWSSEYPNIFDLVYEVKDKDGNVVDTVKSYSTYKSFEAKVPYSISITIPYS